MEQQTETEEFQGMVVEITIMSSFCALSTLHSTIVGRHRKVSDVAKKFTWD